MKRFFITVALATIAGSISCCASSEGMLLENMYCGLESCYGVLGIHRESSPRDIKKAYRILSRKYHPDRNPGADATRFIKISEAHDILIDKDSRAAYDYYIDHPEERWKNQYNLYRVRYAPKTDLRLVLLGFVAASSLFQYISAVQRHRFAMKVLRRDERVLKKARDRVKANKKGDAKAKRSRKKTAALERAIDDVLEENVELIGGFAKPSVRCTLAAWIVLGPYWLVRMIAENGRWFVKVRRNRIGSPLSQTARTTAARCSSTLRLRVRSNSIPSSNILTTRRIERI